MREKLLSLMRSEGLTSSRLAELLGIQPSGISHILSGRNKPSFDFVQKILRRFPSINPDWLLLDQGPMYRSNDATPESATTSEPQTPQLFGNGIEPSPGGTPPATEETTAQPSATINAAQAMVSDAGRHGKVKRIIVMYDDHTFESYTPS